MIVSCFFHLIISTHIYLFTLAAFNYGLFIPNSDLTKGIWLDNGRILDYYMLKNEVCFGFFIINRRKKRENFCFLKLRISLIIEINFANYKFVY